MDAVAQMHVNAKKAASVIRVVAVVLQAIVAAVLNVANAN